MTSASNIQWLNTHWDVVTHDRHTGHILGLRLFVSPPKELIPGSVVGIIETNNAVTLGQVLKIDSDVFRGELMVESFRINANNQTYVGRVKDCGPFTVIDNGVEIKINFDTDDLVQPDFIR